jgi:hypothetical protein
MHQLGKYMEIDVAEFLRKSTLEVEALRTYSTTSISRYFYWAVAHSVVDMMFSSSYQSK